MREQQKLAWLEVQSRLQKHGLLEGQRASISTRIPDTSEFWFGTALDDAPRELSIQQAHNAELSALHAEVYQSRNDISAIAFGHGPYGGILVEHIGEMPGIFDEQVRHLGTLSLQTYGSKGLKERLATGTNMLSAHGELLILGMTPQRLILNASLAEKCAHAYTLAYAVQGHTSKLPWIVRKIAHGRLRSDQKRASKRITEGKLPLESSGY
jgi:ribulose-5-phosphate 4-epimerase/fuculose-1-phosphate aldolase